MAEASALAAEIGLLALGSEPEKPEDKSINIAVNGGSLR